MDGRTLWCGILFFTCVYFLHAESDSHIKLDILTPYKHGMNIQPGRYYRYVTECPKIVHKNRTHESVIPNISSSTFDVRLFSRKFNSKKQFGHHAVVRNPLEMISVLEPKGGCDARSTARVTETASTKHCDVAMNAGFFDNEEDSTHGECYGNIISDSKLVRDAKGVQNANFGIRKDGTVVIGRDYL